MPRRLTGSRVMPGDVPKYGSGSKEPPSPSKQTVKDLKRPGQG